MRIDLLPPAEGDPVLLFEAECAKLGLRAHRGTLAKYEESVHWHITRPGTKGTLEATWWPTNHAFWLEVRTNRRADWMPPIIEALKARF